MYKILDKINSTVDLKKLSIKELNILATDIREALFNRLTKFGGHFGSNFGFVEACIALHYIFNSPIDKFVFDVSHQSYTHKILTGRKLGYIDENHFKEDSGYTNPNESKHDLFNIGHTSTSISLASGLVKARDLLKGKENIIAIIGDGSLSGGEALEGLNVSGSELNSNFIIIVNDNQQSISETHGGIYKNLKELRNSKGKCKNNIFKAMGLDYIYEDNGNDIASLIKVFKKVKDINHPIVVHINTLKGKGYKYAVENKEKWHWVMPFDRKTGKLLNPSNEISYVEIAKKYILDKAKKDKKFLLITPNMPGSFSLDINNRKALGKKFFDTGIAEEDAVAMASGAAKRGAKPLVITNTTFMQRSYDQISQDVCINNSHVTILLNYSSINSLTDVTHLGFFGLSIFSNIPNLLVISPSSNQELIASLNYSLDKRDGPTIILCPCGKVDNRKLISNIDNSFKYEVTSKGSKVAILALGDYYQKGLELSKLINKELKFKPTLINPRFASILDKKLLDSLIKNHNLLITIEDGILEGGFGSKIATYYADKNIRVKNFGLEKKFYDRYNPDELLKSQGIDIQSIFKYINNKLKRNK